jgi:hypothetical protein
MWTGIITGIICIWFAIDCKRLKRFLTDKIEWSLYIVYSIGLTVSLSLYYPNF